MPRFLCRIWRYTMPTSARVANVLAFYMHCMQGIEASRCVVRAATICLALPPQSYVRYQSASH
jgi:hypothetical protein